MSIARFVDPHTGQALEKDSEGNLYRQEDDRRVLYKSYDGCYDFVIPNPDLSMGSTILNGERKHYDKEHSGSMKRELTLDLLRGAWFNETVPWCKVLLESLGELSGKRILLLGNGGSYKELYFLHLGASVVFTDLSIEAVRHVKHEFTISEMSHQGSNAIEFHAVNAMHLPFPDSSFNIVYGSAFVHHLDDLDSFFSEVRRCLKADGICRFFDQADSPLWGTMKRTLLRPVQLYSYRKHPRSPEDLRAALRGVFNKEALALFMKKHRFRGLFFMRDWFFLYIALRHYGKSVGWAPDPMKKARPLFLLMKWLDTRLSGTRWMRKNQLMLVWGFNK